MKERCSKCFKNLGVKSRAKIYSYIEEGKGSSVTDITKYIGLRQPTVSYHLSEMLKSGLLKRKHLGRKVIYSVNPICPHDGLCCVVNVKS